MKLDLRRAIAGLGTLAAALVLSAAPVSGPAGQRIASECDGCSHQNWQDGKVPGGPPGDQLVPRP